MDKTIENIFKTFNHIARELQFYFIPGFLILLNIYALDFFYYENSISNLIRQNYFILAIIIIAYVLGHISIGFFYVIIELPGIDKKINKLLKLNYKIESNILPKLFKEDKESYFHFIERYAMLTLMRWTMSASFFIIFLTDAIFLSIKHFIWQICTLTIVSFISSVLLFILTSKTEKDYADRIESMKDFGHSQKTTEL